MKKQIKVLAVLSTAMFMAAVTPNFIGTASTAYAKTVGWTEETETGITMILTARQSPIPGRRMAMTGTTWIQTESAPLTDRLMSIT